MDSEEKQKIILIIIPLIFIASLYYIIEEMFALLKITIWQLQLLP